MTCISADLTQPGGDAAPVYTVRLRLADAEATKLGPVVLRPGMPVEAFLQTAQHNLLSYFLKPFSDNCDTHFEKNSRFPDNHSGLHGRLRPKRLCIGSPSTEI